MKQMKQTLKFWKIKKRLANLWGHVVGDKVRHQLLVVVGENVLHEAQDVEGGEGAEQEPRVAPVAWKQRERTVNDWHRVTRNYECMVRAKKEYGKYTLYTFSKVKFMYRCIFLEATIIQFPLLTFFLSKMCLRGNSDQRIHTYKLV